MPQNSPENMRQVANSQPTVPWSGPVPSGYQPIQNMPFTNPLPQQPVSLPPPPTRPVTAPVLLLPPTSFQRFLIRLFQPALASNAWLGVGLGGVVAAIGGTLGSALILVIVHALFSSKIDQGQGVITSSLGIWDLHDSFRNALQLHMLALGAGFHLQQTFSGNVDSYAVFSPLHGLLFVPAIFLVLAGYIAASTDFQNRIPVTLGRGAAVAIPYTLLLLAGVSQVNGGITGTDGIIRANSEILNVDIPTLLIFGVLWGSLFGVLGATLKLAYGEWRGMIHTYFKTSRRIQLSSMTAGATLATGLGVAFSLLFLWSVMAYNSFSTPLLSRALCIPTDWQSATVWSIAQGPIHAANLFAFSFGSPISIVNSSTNGANSCFYTMSPHTILNIFDPAMHISTWMYSLLLIPAISLFCGGRVSVALARVQGAGSALLQGAFIAIPFTVFMIVLCLLSTISYTGNYGITSTSSGTFIETAGVDIFNMLLWALLSGAVFGALGGLYQASTLKNALRPILTVIAFPVFLIGRPVSGVLNALSGLRRASSDSTARNLLCSALVCTVLLAIASGIVGSLFINMNQTIDFAQNQHMMNILDVLTIAIPGILVISAGAVALTTDPYAQSVGTQGANVSATHSPLIMQEGM